MAHHDEYRTPCLQRIPGRDRPVAIAKRGPVSDDILSQLTGANPRRLLEDLARLGVALARTDRPRPEVECYLTSGQLVRGRIVAVADDRQGAVALIAVGDSARAPSVTYVRVDHITAVTVVDASLLVKPITEPAP